MNDLQKLYNTLKHGGNEIFIDEFIRQRAMVPIKRLLDFARERDAQVLGQGNA